MMASLAQEPVGGVHEGFVRRLLLLMWPMVAGRLRLRLSPGRPGRISMTQRDERQWKAEKKAPARAAAESCGVWPDSIAAIATSPR